MALNDRSKMKTKKEPESNNTWNENSQSEEIDDEDVDEEELNSINNQLDMLDNALDELEQKNDDIHAQLVQLLETNRQARKQFQQMQNQNVNPPENNKEEKE